MEPILTRQNSWFQLNGFSLLLIMLTLVVDLINWTFDLKVLSMVTTLSILIAAVTNYTGNFLITFYENHMTVEYKLIKRFKTIPYSTIKKAEFVFTPKTGTRLSIVYFDELYLKHSISLFRQDKELADFVKTRLQPIVKTNKF